MLVALLRRNRQPLHRLSHKFYSTTLTDYTIMQVEVGDRLPAGSFLTFDLPDDGCATDRPVPIESSDIFDGKTVVLVGIPGAYTPTCSEKHISSFISKADDFKSKGVDTLACISTNDAFVQAYWAKHLKNGGRVKFLADGNGTFLRAAGLLQDLSLHGMGMRSKRFAMVVKNGIIKYLAVDAETVIGSSSDTVLANLPKALQ